MKKCGLGLLGLTLTSVVALVSANAADIYRGEPGGGYKDGPVYVANTWTGFYAGVNGGYAWNANSFATDPGFLGELNPSGGFGGGQIGYNWQGVFGHPQLVLGVEADFQGADISDSVTASIPLSKNVTLIENAKSTLDWFGTVRGRLGYAFDRSLVYATGGFAYGHITDEASASLTNRVQTIAGGAKIDTTSTGWVVGAGIEHKLTAAWSVKGEYQYINLGQDSEWAKENSKDFDIHTVRVGLNYHVGQGYEPLK
jgi:outer membrane immunogenic protein